MSNKKESVALSSVMASALMSAMKLVGGLMTGSLGILSEAAHDPLPPVAAHSVGDNRKNAWPTPSASAFNNPTLDHSASTYPASEQCPRPGGRSAQPGPHNHTDLEGGLVYQVFVLPFDCQALVTQLLLGPPQIVGRSGIFRAHVPA